MATNASGTNTVTITGMIVAPVYNNGTYPMEYQVLQGAQLLIDVTR